MSKPSLILQRRFCSAEICVIRRLSTFLFSGLFQELVVKAHGTFSRSLRSSPQVVVGDSLSVLGSRGEDVTFVAPETVLLLEEHRAGLRNIGVGETKLRAPLLEDEGWGGTAGTASPGKDISSDLPPVVVLSPLGLQDDICEEESGLGAEICC